MSPKVYEEVIDFIAAEIPADDLVKFWPSEEAKNRVRYLIEQEKSGMIIPEEQSELEHYLQLEHLMRLIKVRARQFQSK